MERLINILLVDDDEVIVMNIKRAFEKNGIANPVWVANDGVEALAILRSSELPTERRILVLDLNMPRMTGIELLREIRKDPNLRSLPVVVFTTSNEARDRSDTWGLNIASFLVKPSTFPEFVEMMSAFNRYWRMVEFP